MGGEVKRPSERNLIALFFCADISALERTGFTCPFEEVEEEEEEDVMIFAAVFKSMREVENKKT